jgi:hypothetical protein
MTNVVIESSARSRCQRRFEGAWVNNIAKAIMAAIAGRRQEWR